MKCKNLIAVFFTLVVFLGFTTCTKQKEFDKISLFKTNSGVSQLLGNLGISSMKIISLNDQTAVYQLVASEFVLNDWKINLNGYIFSVNTVTEGYEVIFENSNSLKRVVFDFNKLKKNIQITEDTFSEEDDVHKGFKIFLRKQISMLLFTEVLNTNTVPTTTIPRLVAPDGGCSRTILSVRTTKSSSIEAVNAATDAFIKAHPDCKKVHGVDSGCLWEDYACVSTQQINCSGGGCDTYFDILD